MCSTFKRQIYTYNFHYTGFLFLCACAYLFQEYVSTGYLNMETTENQNHPNAKHSSRENDNEDEGDKPRDMADITNAKYSWGPRAHKEYSKYAMLKFVVAVS